ncbi:MAG: ABC transporter ATP-binding protein [Selenomonas artemidis]|jgi:oligopeptide ATP binding cassette transporter, ABC protein|nr:ABC transporter ATP-binding protein [Selenomonas artemidis]
MQPEREEILRIEHITKRFPIAGGKVLTACDDVTFPVYKGELLGIVGESGCGKSTLVRTLMQLHAPSEGQIFFRGQEITGLKGEEARNMRRNIQMVFQDPNTAFNPKMKIKDIICEPLRNFGLLKGSARDKAAELLRLVDLPEDFADRYPANMSGGQRQRVGIARALALEPAILVCDEATSALDVSVQEKIVELLIRIQKERDLTILFICHDLALVSMLCTRVVVMYFGKVVEELDGKDLAHAKHRYTQKLLKSVFSLLPKGKAPRIDLSDDVPSPEDQEAAG